MCPSNNSVEFGYDDFYAKYIGVPYNRGLIELSAVQLPLPSVFSATDPQHICLAAMHGHMLYPIDERSIKVRIDDDAPYSKTIAVRIEKFKEMVSEFNAVQVHIGPFYGRELSIVIDDSDPFTIEQFEQVALGDSDIARAALQYEIDRQYHALGHAGRLNHFAKQYNFGNFGQLKAFVERLDAEAQIMGYPSYGTLCTSTRYMTHLLEKYKGQDNMKPALNALKEKQDMLKKESVFIIDQFMKCRATDTKVPYHVDVQADGVLIELREGRFKGAGIVTSEFISDRSERFHDEWFV